MNLMRYKYLYFILSGLVIIPGLISLFLFGVKPAIDFTGGSLLEITLTDSERYQGLDPDVFAEQLAPEFEVQSIQKTGNQSLLLKGPEISNEQKEVALQKIRQQYGEIQEERFESLGPSIGQELLQKAIVALVIAAILITLYVWKQFDELKYGVCAVLAMFHDSLVLLGSFSLLGHFFQVEVDTLFVTAMLTTLSFSVHDTIVVYDRIRELKKKYFKTSLEELANIAVVETLSRSLNNSLTIIIMLLALVLLGGSSIHYFAIALLIGSITGTYSSPFVAVPLLLIWPKKKKAVLKKALG